MTPVQAAFKEYRKKIGKAPEDPNWVPDVNSVTFLHFEAGYFYALEVVKEIQTQEILRNMATFQTPKVLMPIADDSDFL